MSIKVSLWSKIRFLSAFAFGDMTDVAGLALDWLNAEVLQKVKDPEDAALYCMDVKDFATFLRAVLARHRQWTPEARRKAFVAVIDAVDCLAASLEDLKVTGEELSAIVDVVRKAVAAWKGA